MVARRLAAFGGRRAGGRASGRAATCKNMGGARAMGRRTNKIRLLFGGATTRAPINWQPAGLMMPSRAGHLILRARARQLARARARQLASPPSASPPARRPAAQSARPSPVVGLSARAHLFAGAHLVVAGSSGAPSRERGPLSAPIFTCVIVVGLVTFAQAPSG